MIDDDEYPKTKIIGLGEEGEAIVEKVHQDIPLLKYLIISDDLKEIEKEYSLNEFLSNTDVVFVIGLIDDNTNSILNLITDITNLCDIYSFVLLTTGSKKCDLKELKNIMPNTFIIENYASMEIYKILLNILISTCHLPIALRYGSLIHTNIDDVRITLSYGNIHHIYFGMGIGDDGLKNAVLSAACGSKSDISKIKSILFLFKISKGADIFSVENSVENFKKSFNYENDMLFLCVTDEQMPKDESEVTIITSE